MSGGVKKQQGAIGRIMKHQEVSESFRKCQEAPGSLSKQEEGTPRKVINKQTKYSDLKPEVASKIGTVKKHCQLINLLIKGC